MDYLKSEIMMKVVGDKYVVTNSITVNYPWAPYSATYKTVCSTCEEACNVVEVEKLFSSEMKTKTSYMSIDKGTLDYYRWEYNLRAEDGMSREEFLELVTKMMEEDV